MTHRILHMWISCTGNVDIAGKCLRLILASTQVSRSRGLQVTEADYVVVGAGSAGCAIAYPACRGGASGSRHRAWRHRCRPLHQDARRAVLPDEHGALRLGLRDRARAAHEQPPHGLPARQGDRRVVLDQRDDLRAGPRPRLSTPGPRWAPTAGPMPTCFPISGAWRIGTADGGDATWRGTDGPLHITRGEQKNPLFQAFIDAGAAAGYGAHARLQRRTAGGLRRLRAHHLARAALVGRRCLSPPGAGDRQLHLMRGLVDRIEIDEGRATGVRLSDGTPDPRAGRDHPAVPVRSIRRKSS
jgi:choline dehydrogenase